MHKRERVEEDQMLSERNAYYQQVSVHTRSDRMIRVCVLISQNIVDENIDRPVSGSWRIRYVTCKHPHLNTYIVCLNIIVLFPFRVRTERTRTRPPVTLSNGFWILHSDIHVLRYCSIEEMNNCKMSRRMDAYRRDGYMGSENPPLL